MLGVVTRHMKSTYHLFLSLCIALVFAGCVQTGKSERRVVELPTGDSQTTLATAEQICRDLIAGGFGSDVQRKFPALTQQQIQGLFLTWNEGTFQSGKSVFIMTGINSQGDLPAAKDIADYCKSLVENAVSTKFTPTPIPK